MDETGHIVNYRKGNTFCYNYYELVQLAPCYPVAPEDKGNSHEML